MRSLLIVPVVVGCVRQEDPDWRPSVPPDGCCDTGLAPETDVDTDPDPGPTDDEGPDADTAGLGALEVAYAFPGDRTCAELRVDTLGVILVPSGQAPREPYVFPCADDALRIYDLAPGLYEVDVRGESESGAGFGSAGPIAITAGQTTELVLDLVCDPNGLEHGCDGL